MSRKLNKEDCVLFRGAAQGTESAFGAAAERHGVEEVNFTFDGDSDVLSRGIRVLTRLVWVVGSPLSRGRHHLR
jgi:hypothetical protein